MPPLLARLAREGEHAERLGVRLVELERAQLERRHRRRGALRVGRARTRSGRACPGSRGARSRRRRGSGRARARSTSGGSTTSIRSYGTPKRKCASITSRPLFASVAESIVIFGPMIQVGCASASSGVTSASSSRVRPRNGPPLAVSDEALRLAELGALEERRVLAVDRDQRASAPLLRRERELAGGDEALLVRERERDAALERPHRRREPGEADDRVQHEVGLGALEQLGQVAPGLRQRREPVDRLRARRRGDELELRDARRSPRSPGARSSRSRRAGRSASSRQGTGRPGQPCQTRRRPQVSSMSAPRQVLQLVDNLLRRIRTRGCRSTPPARRRAARRSGRACRRGRRAACPCPSPRMSRLSIDSNRSPSGAATAITTPEHDRLAGSRGSPGRRARRRRRTPSPPSRTRTPPTSCRARRAAPSGAGRAAARRSTRACRPPRRRAATVNVASRPCSGMSRRSSSERRARSRPRPRPSRSPRSTARRRLPRLDDALQHERERRARSARRRSSSRRRRAARRRARAARRRSPRARAGAAARASSQNSCSATTAAAAISTNSHQPPRYTAPSTIGSATAATSSRETSVAHYWPPKRRRRRAYSASAPRRSRASKSGQSRSTKTSSA